MKIDTLLGKVTEYRDRYDATLLQPIPRSQGRESLGLSGEEVLQFSESIRGVDIWNAYELSWLNHKNKPCVAMAEFQVPCRSHSIVESKSFKLYLNSFNQTVFTEKKLLETLKRDLSQATGAEVDCRLIFPSDKVFASSDNRDAQCLDGLDIVVEDFSFNPSLLGVENENVSETLYSHLLKSNCPVTGQPDWAMVCITYEGPRVNREGLLKYIISYRNHNEFHEHCVERMYVDILKHCKPKKLMVYARYTRRGGLDINPYRSNFETTFENIHAFRQ